MTEHHSKHAIHWEEENFEMFFEFINLLIQRYNVLSSISSPLGSKSPSRKKNNARPHQQPNLRLFARRRIFVSS